MEDFQKCKEELKTKMIDGLLNYVKDGIVPENKSAVFIECYNMVLNLGNKDDSCKELLKYHNEVIEQATNESYEKIKDLSGDEFIDSFITYTERLNCLILKMTKIFSYLNRYCLRFKKGELSHFSMDIYKKSFFDKLKDKLFPLLKELVNKEGKDENAENKIKTIMKIIDSLDFIKPKINKISKTSAEWIEGNKEEKENPKAYQKMWNEFKA